MFLYMGSICRCIYSSMYFLIYFTILISSWDAKSGLARARPGSRISLLARAGPAVTFPCPSAPLASPSNATLPRGPDQPKPVTKLPRKKRFLFPTIFSLSQNRRQIILRAGTNRFAGSEPETQRSPSLPHLRRRRRRNKEEAGAEDCKRSGGARGASEREKLLQPAGGGRGHGGGRDLGGITRAGTAAGEGVPLDADSPSGILNVSRISRWRGASRSRAGRRLGFGGRRDGGELGGRTGRGWRLLRRRRHLAGDHRLGAPEEWLVVAWQDPGARRAPAVSDHVSEDWYTGQAPWPGGRKRVSFCSRLCLPIIFSSP
jgi:hypothetical protein